MHDCMTNAIILVFMNNINSQWEQLCHERMIVPVSVMLLFYRKSRWSYWEVMIEGLVVAKHH